MSGTLELERLEEEYEDYLIEAENALEIALARITNVQRSLEHESIRSPFDTIEKRLKTFESVMEKCERKGYPKTIESIRENVLDVAGIRVITPFFDDIEKVVDFLRHIPGLFINKEKDYVTCPKDNGYASYHIHACVDIYLPSSKSTKIIPIEIQVRDMSMNLWATTEHLVKYKHHNPDPEVSQQFKEMADILREAALKAMELRDLQMKLAGIPADLNQN